MVAKSADFRYLDWRLFTVWRDFGGTLVADVPFVKH